MDWITDAIAIGNHFEAHDPDFREQHCINSLISLDGSINDERALASGYADWVCISMLDGPGNESAVLSKIVQTLIDMVESSPPVLVHCHAGRSRSVTVVAGYLVKTRGWSVRAAYDFVASKRETAVQAGLLELLQRLVNL